MKGMLIGLATICAIGFVICMIALVQSAGWADKWSEKMEVRNSDDKIEDSESD